MELNQNNQTLIFSHSQVKNNNGKSNMWETAKQSQIKSASRMYLDGKNNTSKEIIEKFTNGLDRESLQNKPKSKTTGKNINNRKNSSQIANNTLIKNNNNTQQNFNQSISSNFQKGLIKINTTATNNPILENSKQTKTQKTEKSVHPKIENNLGLNDNVRKKKLVNKNSVSQSKKDAKILEMGHSKIVHELENHLSKKKKGKTQPEKIIPLNENEKNFKVYPKADETFENSKIDIEYTESESFDSLNENLEENLKDSLLHLLNHFNTKIKGKINGDNFGEFEIKTKEGNFFVSIKRENNHIAIKINSNLIYHLEGHVENIENAILEKMPEIDSITIKTTHLSLDFHPTKSENFSKQRIKINQDSIFKLNFLA